MRMQQQTRAMSANSAPDPATAAVPIVVLNQALTEALEDASLKVVVLLVDEGLGLRAGVWLGAWLDTGV